MSIFDVQNGGFNRRYASYLKEMQFLNTLTVPSNNNKKNSKVLKIDAPAIYSSSWFTVLLPMNSHFR
jgi:hypothetical protein